MSSTYEILCFDAYSDKIAEPMGTKPKYWVEREGSSGSVKWLFKVPRTQTGEYWAEKVAYELAKRIDLPAARTELATLELEGNTLRGTVSQSFTPGHCALIHGNELLERVVPGYDKEKRYRQREHRIDSIFEALQEFELAGPPGSEHLSAAECLVGYIVFDGWIANVDRHHENWGMLADSIDRIAPSFDHASSLGRLLSDEKRLRILEGRDRLQVDDFVSRGKATGAIYPVTGTSGVPPWKLVSDLVAVGLRDEVETWLERIDIVLCDGVESVFTAFPDDWISESSRRFAIAILKTTYRLMRLEIDR